MANRTAAGRWLLILTLYFFTLSILIYGLEYTTGKDIASSGGALAGDQVLQGYCDSPRYTIAEDGTEIQKPASKGSCEISRAVNNQTCQDLVGYGCSWVLDGSDYVCEGSLNRTALNGGETPGFFDFNICDYDTVEEDKDLCYALGCTWTDEFLSTEELYRIKTPTSVGGMVKDFVTLQLTIDSPYPLLNGILNTIFIFMPIFLWVIALVALLLG